MLFAATLTALQAPLTEGHSLGWPWWTWLLIAIAVLLGAVTFVVEKKTEARGEVPLLPPSLLRLPSMSRGLVMVLIFSMGFGSFMFVFALTIQDGRRQGRGRGRRCRVPPGLVAAVTSVVSLRRSAPARDNQVDQPEPPPETGPRQQRLHSPRPAAARFLHGRLHQSSRRPPSERDLDRAHPPGDATERQTRTVAGLPELDNHGHPRTAVLLPMADYGTRPR